MADSEKGLSVWNKVVTGAMKAPFVKVDRNTFLHNRFKLYCNEDTLDYLVQTCPAMCVDEQIIKKVARDCIAKATRNVTLISTAAGIPGGFAMLGTIPADLAQFYGHVFHLCQELAYIYGYPDLTDENGQLSEESINVLTLFVGVMMGVSSATKGIHELAKALSKQVVKKLPRMALTKTAIYPLVKTVATWIGIKMNKDIFAKGVSKVIPLVGGVLSGSVTYISFKPMAKKLNNALSTDMYLLTERFKSN